MSRHAARERALQTLFQMDVNHMDTEQAITAAADILEDSPYDEPLYLSLLEGVPEHLLALDQLLKSYSQDWEVDRMPGVDRTILRIAVLELVYQAQLPHAVVIDEAVELCKEYGTERSAKFVNGVLAAILQDIESLRLQVHPTDQ